jgi:trk system potassium uptake protein TrkH
MNFNYLINAFRILGLLLMPFSATMLPPILVAWWYHENTVFEFMLATVVTLCLGIAFWFPFRKIHQEMQAREAFLIVTLLWIALSLTGAFPFFLMLTPELSYVDALFETISGLTTTGATVFNHLDTIPRSILYYRQQLQFIGGGGVIVLSIAILPILGIGGMQLFRAEMASPFKEDKLTPRITQTAKTLWFIYVGLVILCAGAYWVGGMTFFDAICYSFSTISTGGFGTHDHNFAYFQSPLLELICVLFMVAGGINFSLHFAALRRKNLYYYWQDTETKTFLILLFSVFLLLSATLLYYKTFAHPTTNLLQTLFHTTSFLTTTGFTGVYTTGPEFYHWPTFVPFLLIFLAMIGGCAGSTAGGIKVIRLLILRKQGTREINRLIHPNGHYVIKLGFSRLHDRTLEAILGFFCLFVVTFIVLFLMLLAFGADYLSAFSAIAASISNTGLRFAASPDYFQGFNTPCKMIICLSMLAGRLELFTILLLLSPRYWRY